MSVFKKTISLIVSALLALCMIPATAFAELTPVLSPTSDDLVTQDKVMFLFLRNNTIITIRTPDVAPPGDGGWQFVGWYIEDSSGNTYFSDGTQDVYIPSADTTIKFVNSDGSAITKSGVGSTANIVKKEGYKFTGWSIDKNASSDYKFVLKADYELITYDVTFKDYDGSIIDKQKINYGEEANPPSDPYRRGYTFTGWDKDTTKINSDLDITAKYEINSYDVKFKDYDGSVLKSEVIEYGTQVTAPENPSREGYKFIGWDKDYSDIAEDIEINAKYKINTYVVTFKDWDGSVLKAEYVDHGYDANPPDPSRLYYKFTGWDKSYDNIKQNTIITAQYVGEDEENDDSEQNGDSTDENKDDESDNKDQDDENKNDEPEDNVKHVFNASLTNTKFTYTGSEIKPVVRATFDNKSVNTSVYYDNNVDVGNATADIIYEYNGSVYEKSLKFSIIKADSKLKIGNVVDSISVPYKTNSKIFKVINVSGGSGIVTVSKASGNSHFSLNNNGQLIVNGTPKVGIYPVEIKVKDSGNSNINNATKTSTINVKVTKINNTMTVKAKKVNLKKNDKRNQTLRYNKVFNINKAVGKLSYKKVSKGSSKSISIDSKGKITVKKGAKGNLKLKVKITAKGDGNYNRLTKTVTTTIKVK